MLPGVRFACDGYVELVRERTALEAVASSLTEFFSPDLMTRRVLAWERHYPWVSQDTLEYFRSRSPRARQDSLEAIDFVVAHATTYELQERCVAALIRKTEILWHLLDSLYAAYVEPGWGPGGARDVISADDAGRGSPPRRGCGATARRRATCCSTRSAASCSTPPRPTSCSCARASTRWPRSSSELAEQVRAAAARTRSSARCSTFLHADGRARADPGDGDERGARGPTRSSPS